MRTTLTTSITKLSSLFRLVEEHSINRTNLLEIADIDISVLNSPDNRLSLDEVHRLTEKAVVVTSDAYFGLHQGEQFMGFSNILGYVMMNCDTLKSALLKLRRYQKICDEGTSITLIQKGNDAILNIAILDDMLQKDKHLTDYRLSGVYVYLKKLAGVSFGLTRVSFCHAPPEDISEYERIFNCPISFNQPFNALIFDYRYLDLSIPEHNVELLKTFEQHAKDIIESLDINDSYTNRAGKIIAGILNENTLSIQIVAKKMAVSVRKLQLKLQQEKTTYSKLLNDIRKGLAVSYLKNRQISITEIAYLLGYSEVSVFYRAFKKWTDKTPIQYRDNDEGLYKMENMLSSN